MAPDNHTAEQTKPLLPSDAGRADYGIATDRQIDQETQEEPEHQAERWNEPRINAWRVLATYYSFIVVGANDGSYGALIPYLQKYYDADYAAVSVVFLSSFIGYATAALINHSIHVRFGQRGVAILGCGMHIIAYLAVTRHPPYPILIAIFILAGLGNGIIDASWNAWIGAMADSSMVMGLLHAFYGLGAALAPLIATTLFTKSGWQWYEFYYIMALAGAVEFVTSVVAFWNARGIGHTVETAPADDEQLQSQQQKSPTVQALALPSTWIISAYLFVYVGSEVTVGGWLLTFLVDLRHTAPFAAGIANFAYWAGITGGRVVLGFLTPYLKKQKTAVTVYLIGCVAAQLIFYTVDNFVASAIAITCLGFFLGPLFPEAVIAQTKILPKHLHVAAVGFACALGSAGGCTFPFITGAIAKSQGIGVLQPMVLVMLCVCLGLWFSLPTKPPGARRAANGAAV